MNLLSKKNYFHLFFLSLLFIHYFFPLVTVGQVIIDPYDALDIVIPSDHIISKIYKGEFESTNYFLSGELKWYFFENIFYPINLFHYILNDKFFYFFNDIFIKVTAYFSFYILAKSFKISRLTCGLGAVLYSSILFYLKPYGFALPLLPYVLYLLINKDSLKTKHYIILFFLSLHTSVMRDIFALAFLFPLAFFITKREIRLNFYIKILSIVIIVPILASMHIILGALFFEEVHRAAFQNVYDSPDFLSSLIKTFDYHLMGFKIYNPYLFFKIPSNILLLILLFFSIFIKEKKIKFLLFFIIFILFIRSFFQSPLGENIFIGIFEILKGFNFSRVDRILPISYVLLFVLILSKSKKKIIKNILYVGCFISILSLQFQTPLVQIIKYQLKKNLYDENYYEVKKNISNKKYSKVLKILSQKENYEKKELEFNNFIDFTFNNYYKFDNYNYIKQIVKNSRVMSVGLDPLIAVMNDIKVIDGYHTIYPLSYKIKFRNIIKEELKKNALIEGSFKSSFDDAGSRVYAYYNDKNNILLNFSAAKDIGAKYVISKFPINNNNLKIVCFECNNSKKIFLYEIL